MVHSFWNAMQTTDVWNNKEVYDRAERSEWGEGAIRYYVQFGIPLFFYISGMTGAHYNVEKRGFIQYLVAKIKRLFLPFLVAYCLILIPRLYSGQSYSQMCQLTKDVNGV